jgi:hypothetical protein
MAAATKLLLLSDSVEYMRKNMGTEFPSTQASNRTISNIPAPLHKEMLDYCKENKLSLYELLAGLWDFVIQYEAVHEAEIAAANNRKAR